MNTEKKSQIIIKDLELYVSLGWTKEEREKKQKIHASINIEFLSEPSACLTDDLLDTIDYDQLCEKITTFSSTQEFKLIERLGFNIYETVKSYSKHSTKVSINITKKPPIKNINQVVFSYGDI